MTMANACIQYTEDMVGQNHATKSDTLNRLVVGINNFRLIKSGSNLTLEAVNGNLVDINGKIYAVTTLPTLGVGGLSASTTYYIYLYDSSGTATLEASATAYTVDTKGRANQTGDATRRLMGIARTTAGTAWADTAAQRFVRSYDNDQGVGGLGSFTTARNTNSTSWVEVNAEIRVEFLSLPGDVTTILESGGYVYPTGAGGDCYTAIGIDGTTPDDGSSVGTQASATYKLPVAAHLAKTGLATGYHYATLLGKKSAAPTTVEWTGSATAGDRTTIQVHIPGRN